MVGAGCFLGRLGLSAQAGGNTYTVKRGDTLSGIAVAHGTTVRAIKETNNLRSDLIRIGQELTIPGLAQDSTGALAPVIAANRNIQIDRNRWRYIVAHHSAIERGNAAIYGAAHRRRGMENGLAYHFVIGCGVDSGDGEIEVGPRWHKQLNGGHVRNHAVNNTGIGICLVGNFENRSPTRRQHASFVQLVDYLRARCTASNCTFSVHKWIDRNHTLCPGKHFPYAEMRRRYV